MGAFDGYIKYTVYPILEKEKPGLAKYPGDWVAENSNKEFLYPWGRKIRNPDFIGPIKSGVRLLTAHEDKTQETTQLI